MNIESDFEKYYKKYISYCLLFIKDPEKVNFAQDFLDILDYPQHIQKIFNEESEYLIQMISENKNSFIKYLEKYFSGSGLIHFSFQDLYDFPKNSLSKLHFLHSNHQLDVLTFHDFKHFIEPFNFNSLKFLLQSSNISSLDIFNHCQTIENFDWNYFDVSFLSDYEQHESFIASRLVENGIHCPCISSIKKHQVDYFLKMKKENPEAFLNMLCDYHYVFNFEDEKIVHLFLENWHAPDLLGYFNTPKINAEKHPEIILNYIKDKKLLSSSLPFCLESILTPIDLMRQFGEINTNLFELEYFKENRYEIISFLKNKYDIDYKSLKKAPDVILHDLLSQDDILLKTLESVHHSDSIEPVFIEYYFKYLDKKLTEFKNLMKQSHNINDLEKIIFFELLEVTGRYSNINQIVFKSLKNISHEDEKIHLLKDIQTMSLKLGSEMTLDFLQTHHKTNEYFSNRYSQDTLEFISQIPEKAFHHFIKSQDIATDFQAFNLLKKFHDFDELKFHGALSLFQNFSQQELTNENKEKLNDLFYQFDECFKMSFDSFLFFDYNNFFSKSYREQDKDSLLFKEFQIIEYLEQDNVEKKKKQFQQHDENKNPVFSYFDQIPLRFNNQNMKIFYQDKNSVSSLFNVQNMNLKEIDHLINMDFSPILNQINDDILKKNFIYLYKKSSFKKFIKSIFDDKEQSSLQATILSCVIDKKLTNNFKKLFVNFLKSHQLEVKKFIDTIPHEHVFNEEEIIISKLLLLQKDDETFSFIKPYFSYFHLQQEKIFHDYLKNEFNETKDIYLNHQNKIIFLEHLCIHHFDKFLETLRLHPDDLTLINQFQFETIKGIFSHDIKDKKLFFETAFRKNGLKFEAKTKEDAMFLFEEFNNIKNKDNFNNLALNKQFVMSLQQSIFPVQFKLLSPQTFSYFLFDFMKEYPVAFFYSYENRCALDMTNNRTTSQILLKDFTLKEQNELLNFWSQNRVFQADLNTIRIEPLNINFIRPYIEVENKNIFLKPEHLPQIKKEIEISFENDLNYFVYMHHFENLTYNILLKKPDELFHLYKENFGIKNFDSKEVIQHIIINEILNKDKFLKGFEQLLILSQEANEYSFLDTMINNTLYNLKTEFMGTIFLKEKIKIFDMFLHHLPDYLFKEHAFFEHDDGFKYLNDALEQKNIDCKIIYRHFNCFFEEERLSDYRNILHKMIDIAYQQKDMNFFKMLYHDFKDNFYQHECIFLNLSTEEKISIQNSVKTLMDEHNILMSIDQPEQKKNNTKNKL